ncbi:MAG: sigma-54 dependent transcriptional regulator [Proteobacteria bacterium]|nr:sigma-54 dependent transcriptional regulator [Pseudomonadota bacterium]
MAIETARASAVSPARRTSKPILLVEDDATLNRLIIGQLERAGFTARGVLRAKDAMSAVREDEPALVLLDIRLPDANGLDLLAELTQHCPVIVLTAHGAIDQAVRALKLGAHDYLTKPVRAEELELAIDRALDHAQLRRDGAFLKDQLQSLTTTSMIGSSPAFGEVRRQIELFAPTDATVLVLGESGVGKELVARAIHDSSPRAGASYVAIDCSTLHENLFESELFGHERGAFTGADRRKLGLIEVAEGGTVFLDEIGELSASLQAKLLRVLELGTFRRVGGVSDLKANVRFVAATNRDLVAMSREGRFRTDLYYRLSRFVLNVPPLRERGDDVMEIAQHFLKTRNFNRGIEKVLDSSAVAAIRAYSWPGNVRELKNVIERAVVLSAQNRAIRASEIGLDPRKVIQQGNAIEFSFGYLPTIEEVQNYYVDTLLRRGNFSRARIAEVLDISERSVYRILQQRREAGASPEDEPENA